MYVTHMSEDSDNKNIDVRTFKTMDEIKSLDGFIENNPVDKDNYVDLIGDYTFDYDVKCCRKKENGNLCNTNHQWGFVAILKDKSITIIGNHCIKTKFEPDSDIHKRRNLYVNKQRKIEKLERLNEFLIHKSGNLMHLENIRVATQRIRDSVRTFETMIGDRSSKKLEHMAKVGDGSVFVDAISYRSYTDEVGHEQKEPNVVMQKLGTLHGISIFNPGAFQSIYSAIREVNVAYRKADELTEDSTITDIEKVTSAVGVMNQIDVELKNIQQAKSLFFNNDFTLLCFLTEDKSERYKAARYLLDRSGVEVGRDKAKVWLGDQENALKTKFKAEKIRIHG